MPGGVTRTVAFYDPHPVAFVRGSGAQLEDADGNLYIDLLNNYTALVHGNAHPRLTSAAANALRDGGIFPAPHSLQVEHARRILSRFPAAARVRYTNSGTEAAMLAVRVARALTGRDAIAKARGAYHGTYDALWSHVGGQSEAEGAEARQPGVAKAVHALTHVFEFNDVDSIQTLEKSAGHHLAAIIVEPLLAAAGALLATPEFLAACREVCDRTGALLIFDEVQTSRLEMGGLQEHFGIWPDLTVLGKWIGGGLPIGAVAGTAAAMGALAAGSRTFVNHSGTFNGNGASLAAGLAAIDLLDASAIRQINAHGDSLAASIRSALASRGMRGSVTGYGSLINVHFGIDHPSRVSDTNTSDLQAMDWFHLALLTHGMFAAHRGMMNVSTALGDDGVVEASKRVERALDSVRETSM